MNKQQLEHKLHECRCMNEELQHECQLLDAERTELRRKNDDLAIANADYEMQLKQHRDAAIEAHQEAVQTSRQLHEAKQKVESLNSIVQRFDRDVERAICICRQHLIVSLNLPIKKPDCEVCETSRFIYYLLDILDGE